MYRPVPFLFAFKFYGISSLIILLLNTLSLAPYRFVSTPFLVHIKTSYALNASLSFYSQMALFDGTLEIIFMFLWMASFLSNYEKKCSTVFVFFDIFLQNLILNIIFIIFGLLLINIFLSNLENLQDPLSTLFFYKQKAESLKVVESIVSIMLNFGWLPLCIIYAWKESGLDPEGEINFCFTFKLKKKYIPFLLFVFSVFSSRAICCMFAMMLGFYQSKSEHNVIYKLPLSFYQKVQSTLPENIRRREDFVTLADISLSQLTTKCYQGGKIFTGSEFSGFSEQISSEAESENYKMVWKNKTFQEDEEDEQINQ